MPKVFAKSILSFMVVLLLLSVIHMGCSSRHLEQNPVERYYEESAPAYSLEQSEKNATEQSQKAVTSTKPKETSIFSVIEIEDVEYPTLAVSIHLPFGVRPNNTVCLVEKHAYLTTERHLHVIDVSIPQRPSYVTSLAFPDEIGKVLASGNYLVVASEKKFYLVDISQPLHPIIESTGHLPQQHPIKDFDALDNHLYIMGENDYLYIFYAPRGQARLVKVVELEKRWWLLSLKVDSPEVIQIPQWTSNSFPEGVGDPFLSQRRFLQLRSSKQEKVRASSVFLVVERLRDPTYDLLSFDAYRRVDDHRTTVTHVAPNLGWPDVPLKDDHRTTVIHIGSHDLMGQFREYLIATGQKTFTRRTPARVYVVATGKMQEIPPKPSSKTIEVEDKRLIGPVTDFQISGDRLYIVTANGVFFILPIINPYAMENMRDIEIMKERWSKWRKGEKRQSLSTTPLLSATPLQANRPISLAVGEGEHYAYVLSHPEDSQR